ncbi:MAG: BatA and WFA domain-containing protein [Proteobacteria bacterium]|nr:BatA and WFA domain-containing protein [Pseudomonadota bacterium]
MTDFFSKLHFTNPLLLSGLLVSFLLILAYLKQKIKTEVTFSSNIFLKKLPKQIIAKQKFKPPLRFFLELASLLFLSLAAAQPFLKNDSNQEAIIIDNSLSMQANIPNEFLSRLKKAKEEAKSYLSSLGSYNKRSISIINTRDTNKILQSEDKDKLIQAIDAIEPSYAEDNFEAVAELIKNSVFSAVNIYSDKDITEKNSLNSVINNSYAKLNFKRIGTVTSNIYISSFFLNKTSFPEPHQELVANFTASSSKQITADVIFSNIAETESIIHKTQIKLNPNETSEVKFELSNPENFKSSIFKVNITTKDAAVDAIKDDNSAWIGEKGQSSGNILLVSATRNEATGFERLPGFNFTSISLEEYNKLSEQELKKFLLLIFHRCSPINAPRIATLLILPPKDNLLFSVKEIVVNPKITSWQMESPINSYLKVPLLTFNESEIFNVPLWGKSIINSENGSILSAGESEDVRFAAVGFELLPFEGAKTPTISILTLNLINWLSAQGNLNNYSLSGSNFMLSGNAIWKINTPNKETKEFNLINKKDFNYVLSSPGIYSISRFTQDGILEEKKVIYANPFYPKESSTNENQKYQFNLASEDYASKTNLEKNNSEELWKYLVIAILLLLSLELIYSSLRRSNA